MIDNSTFQHGNGSDISSSTSSYPKYGYDIDDIEEFNSRFKCIFCFLIIQEPIQLTECGHRCCRNCFDVRAASTTDGNVTCPLEDCRMVTNKNQIMPDKAFKRELDVIRIACRFRQDHQCSWTGQLKDYTVHLDENHVQYICSDCEISFPSKILLDEHVVKCPTIFQSCPLQPLCTQEMIRITEFSNHLLGEKHQEALNKLLTGQYNLAEVISQPQEMEITTSNNELEEKISENLENLSKDIQKVNDEIIELNTGFDHLTESVTTIGQELTNCHQTMNERLPIKQNLQSNQEQIQRGLEELQQTYDNNQHISTDGTLTWRIEHVSEKMADAQSERQTSIYSPIFYSSPTGYKMRARLFLFGDGNARRTHISLFFLLMKGEYDAILKWPFHYKVTFSLLDQTGNNRHIIDSFQPDVKSNSFQRPKDISNTASGIPKFFPLPMLLQDDNAYVREDTLYIKIIIALDDTPKLLLPFMLTLNPALPNYVQDNLIQQEAIKRQQVTASPSTTMNTGR